MKMTDALMQIAPNTTKEFLSYLMYNFGMSANEFETKELPRRYLEIRRFFGYSKTIPDDMPGKEMQADIKHLFKDYEDIMAANPDGVPDRLKAIKNMTLDEKAVYIKEHWTSPINTSLCHSLIPRTVISLLSLKDALVARVLTQIEKITSERLRKEAEDVIFWNNTLKNFNKDEIVPF